MIDNLLFAVCLIPVAIQTIVMLSPLIVFIGNCIATPFLAVRDARRFRAKSEQRRRDSLAWLKQNKHLFTKQEFAGLWKDARGY